MEKKRNVLVDVLKAYAIFLVVLGHVIQTFCPEWNSNSLEVAIVMFHMPLFITISGYFFVKSAEKCCGWQLVKKRFVQLMFPSLTMGLIECAIMGGGKILKHSELEFLYFANLLFTGLWFLTTLFVLTLVGALLYCRFKTSLRFYFSWLVVWGILYLLPDLWIFNQMEFLCPFYVMGIAVRNINLYRLRKVWMIFAVLLFALCYSIYSFDSSMYSMGSDCLSQQYLWNTCLRITGGASGIVVSVYLAKLLARMPFGMKLLANVGMMTLPIYVLHQKFLLTNVFLKYTTGNIFFCVFVSILLMTITIYTYKFLRRNKYIALFLFGEDK